MAEIRSTLLGLMKIIAATDNRLEGRVRMQKLAFLAGMKGMQYVSPTSFDYHYYGPYSRELSEALQIAVAAALIEEEPQSFSPGQKRYAYKLTEAGRTWLAEQASEEDRGFSDLISKLNHSHLKTLELSATVSYLQAKEGLQDREAALTRAIELKPDCSPFKKAAAEVLDSIGL